VNVGSCMRQSSRERPLIAAASTAKSALASLLRTVTTPECHPRTLRVGAVGPHAGIAPVRIGTTTLDESIAEQARENRVSPFPRYARTNTDRPRIRSWISLDDA
jgi:hypothetical protein